MGTAAQAINEYHKGANADEVGRKKFVDRNCGP